MLTAVRWPCVHNTLYHDVHIDEGHIQATFQRYPKTASLVITSSISS